MSPRTVLVVVLVVVLVGTACAASPHPSSSSSSSSGAGDLATLLERQTQALVDAVTAGRADVWARSTADDLLYVAEDGAVKDRAALLGEIRPLPPDISGVLRVTDFVARRHGNAAITSYVVDEHETYFGQAIRARYRETDTWIETADGWKLVAAQVLALRDDPPAIALPAAQLDGYAGTYALTAAVTTAIRREGDALVAQRTGRPAETLRAEAPDVFFVPGRPRLRTIFQRGADGRVTGFVERRETWDVRWTRRD